MADSIGSVVAAAQQLGISKTNLYAWRNKFRKTQAASVGIGESKPNENEEVVRLRKEVAELKKVNHILKAAAAFFSQDHLK